MGGVFSQLSTTSAMTSAAALSAFNALFAVFAAFAVFTVFVGFVGFVVSLYAQSERWGMSSPSTSITAAVVEFALFLH